MRSTEGSRRIVVQDVEYRWRATGNDGYISIGIWPLNNIGAFIHGNIRYHETWTNNDDGSRSSDGNQIIVSNRIIRRVIEYAIAKHHYSPLVKATEINLMVLDNLIKWDDAIRASNTTE